MALPTLFKTWKFKRGTVAAQGTADSSSVALIIALKDAMIGAGSWNDINGTATTAPTGLWTVIGSSDGNTAALDAVDRWTSVAALNVAHTPWIVLRSVALGMYVVFGLASVSLQSTNVLISRAAFTGGTINAYPTATDQAFALQSTAWGGPATNIATWLACEMATDGATRLLMFRNGLTSNWMFEPVASPSSGWLYPSVALCYGSSGTGNNGTWPNSSTKATGHNNAGATLKFIVCEPAYSINGTLLGQTITVPNPVNSKWPIFGVLLYSDTTSNLGVYGHLQDIFFGAVANPTGDCYDDTAATTRRFLQADRWVFPWDTSNPTINPNGSEPSKTIRNAEYSATILAPANTSPPLVSNFVPALGTTIQPTDQVGFDVTDDSGLMAAILVYVSFGGSRPVELVHDSSGFRYPYSSSARSVVSLGFRYVVKRTGGWPTGPTFVAHAIDLAGNVNT